MPLSTRGILHHSDLINLIPRELDIESSPFCDTEILTYEFKLPTSGKKFGVNLLDCEYVTIPRVIDEIPNSPAGHQLPMQAKKMC